MRSEAESFSVDTVTIDTYNKIIESGDLSHLSKKLNETELEKTWINLQQQIIEIVGENETYKSYLRHKIEYIKHRKKFLIDGDKWSKTLAEIENIEAENDLNEMPKGESILETVLRLSKIQGYHIRAKETSVREYFTLIKMNSNGKA